MAERVVAHLKSFRANTVDTRVAYVAINRARSSAALYTDSRTDLLATLGARDGAQVGALDAADFTTSSPPATRQSANPEHVR